MTVTNTNSKKDGMPRTVEDSIPVRMLEIPDTALDTTFVIISSEKSKKPPSPEAPGNLSVSFFIISPIFSVISENSPAPSRTRSCRASRKSRLEATTIKKIIKDSSARSSMTDHTRSPRPLFPASFFATGEINSATAHPMANGNITFNPNRKKT